MKKRWVIIIISTIALIVGLAIAARPAARRHAEWVNCGNQMHLILYVATLAWPQEHNDLLPSDFLSMSNELVATTFLICPSDRKRHAADSWSSFSAENCSYEMVTPGLRKGDTNSVFLRCPIHGYTGYADDRLLDASGRSIRKEVF